MTFQGYNITTQTYPPVEPQGLPAFGSTPFVIDRASDSITLTWAAPLGFTTTDYIIEFQDGGTGPWILFSDSVSTATTAVVTGLTQLTIYTFRVRAVNGLSFTSWSGIVTTSTLVSNVFFDSNYSYFNVIGGTSVTLGAYENGTEIFRNGVSVANLSQGQVTSVTSASGDVFSSDNKFIANTRSGTNLIGMPSRLSAGSVFSVVSTRNNPQTVYYRAFQGGTIELRAGGAVLDSATLTDGASGTLVANFIGNMQIVSTGLVVCYFGSSGFVDAQLMVPDSDTIIGVPSSSAQLITSVSTSVAVTALFSNSVQQAASVNSGVAIQITPQGTSSQYASNTLLLTSSNGEAIGAASFADADGTAAARFLPTVLMKTEFMITDTCDWVAFCSLQAGTVAVLNAAGGTIATLTLVRSGANVNAPYKAYSTTDYPAGTRFKSTVPVAAWWEDTLADDETLLLGLD